jgi:tetratricopeptide (TPR) repeat protein
VGDNKSALQALSEYLKLVNDNPRAYYYLSLVYNDSGQIEGALKAMEVALELDPLNIEYIYNYILMLEKGGQKSKARSILQEALDYFGQNEKLESLKPYFGL